MKSTARIRGEQHCRFPQTDKPVPATIHRQERTCRLLPTDRRAGLHAAEGSGYLLRKNYAILQGCCIASTHVCCRAEGSEREDGVEPEGKAAPKEPFRDFPSEQTKIDSRAIRQCSMYNGHALVRSGARSAQMECVNTVRYVRSIEKELVLPGRKRPIVDTNHTFALCINKVKVCKTGLG